MKFVSAMILCSGLVMAAPAVGVAQQAPVATTEANNASGTAGLSSVITIIGGAGENQTDFSGVGEGAGVTVIMLSTVQPDAAENLDDLTSAVETNAESIRELRRSLSDNEVLSAQITETCQLENVLAVVTMEDGSYMIYCDDLTAAAKDASN